MIYEPEEVFDRDRLIREKINLLRDAEPGISNPSAPYCKPLNNKDLIDLPKGGISSDEP
jgi:hypothetical protein